MKRKFALLLTGILAVSALAGCGTSGTGTEGGSAEQVIIYSNADDEAVEAMKATDGNSEARRDHRLHRTRRHFGAGYRDHRWFAAGTFTGWL